MAAEIKAIHGGHVPGQPCEAIVETLERMLAEAKRGDITAIAYATVRGNGVIGTGWDGEDGARYPVASAVMMLHHRYAEAMLSGDAR